MAKLRGRQIVVGSAAGFALSVGALFGSGLAGAAPPDVVGETYADAASTLEEADLTPKVIATVGGRLPQDECIVTSVSDHKYLRPATDDTIYEYSWDEVWLSLNCNGSHATANSPGASVASPEGREAADHEEEVQWRSENPEWCEDAMLEHPEWGEMEGCTYE
ncbi:hypothetical protein [Mycolicibacterium sp. XJ870]